MWPSGVEQEHGNTKPLPSTGKTCSRVTWCQTKLQGLEHAGNITAARPGRCEHTQEKKLTRVDALVRQIIAKLKEPLHLGSGVE